MNWVLPAWSPQNTLILRSASNLTVIELAICVTPRFQLSSDVDVAVASPGATARKFLSVGSAAVRLISTAVAPTGTASVTVTAPAALWPLATLTTRDAFGASGPFGEYAGALIRE